MKPLVLLMVPLILFAPRAQLGQGILDPMETKAFKIDGWFKPHAKLHARVIGGGYSDLDCYFSDGIKYHYLGQDFSTDEGCDLTATNQDKVWLVIFNNGNNRDSYRFEITEEKSK
jgi:hypothetical protein